jgi:hypothetical protein
LRPEPDTCEICSKPPAAKVRRKLHSEHDHLTKTWRGWVWAGCNRVLSALDRMRDDPLFAIRLLEFQARGGAPVPLKHELQEVLG